MFGSSGAQGQQPVAIKGIRIQSSTYGVAQPLIYGTTRVTVNLIDYTDFYSVTVSNGGGGK